MKPPSSVPLLDLTRLDAGLKDQLHAAFERVLAGGHFILGPEVLAFESEVANYLGVEHAIGVSSGTDAILVALMALGVGPGDEVICPTYTFFATAGCVARVGAIPVFVDCNRDSYNVDPASVEQALTPRTKCVIPVHLFGQCAEMDPITDLCRRKGLPIIEDAAQSIGADYKGRRAGTIGTVGCFSFFPSKSLGALGDGGLVVTRDAEIAEKIRVLRGHGAKPKYFHRHVGGNFRLDALQAALLRCKLPYLERWITARQRNAAAYHKHFADYGIGRAGVSGPAEMPGCRHTYNQFVVRVSGPGRRDALRSYLQQRQIGTEIYYPLPMHQQECFAGSHVAAADLRKSEAAARETLALPIFPELRQPEIDMVVETIRAFLTEDAARVTASSQNNLVCGGSENAR